MREGIGVAVIDDSLEFVSRMDALVSDIPGLTLVGSAATPSAAIELVFARQPGIVILDLYLTGGSGIEVLNAIRDRKPDTQVVVVTGDPSAELSQACLGLGARYFFDKALEFEEMEAAMRTLGQETPETETAQVRPPHKLSVSENRNSNPKLPKQ